VEIIRAEIMRQNVSEYTLFIVKVSPEKIRIFIIFMAREPDISAGQGGGCPVIIYQP
jgi:hypothetical protein